MGMALEIPSTRLEGAMIGTERKAHPISPAARIS